MEWTECQKLAWQTLKHSRENVFLTGGAGSGKSTLIRKFLGEMHPTRWPVLASTGAAAILVGGRTFHSFFGLGLMEGADSKVVERALTNKFRVRILKKVEGVIIDEVSMLGGRELRVAEAIARKARENSSPWGGMRVIAVGDFAQLPPVSRDSAQMGADWGFLDPVWQASQFEPAVLKTLVRAKDISLMEVLKEVRVGGKGALVQDFLDARRANPADKDEFEGTLLYARREWADQTNLLKLNRLPGEAREYLTVYRGDDRWIDGLRKTAPIGEKLTLKKGCLVMLRTNDPDGRWVNGSLGKVTSMETESISVHFLDSGRTHRIEAHIFSAMGDSDSPMASAIGFPVNLAWATTIHKAQGATLDRLWLNLKGAWEHGQAYVALSRVRYAKDLWVENGSLQAIVVDPRVEEFHRRIGFI